MPVKVTYKVYFLGSAGSGLLGGGPGQGGYLEPAGIVMVESPTKTNDCYVDMLNEALRFVPIVCCVAGV